MATRLVVEWTRSSVRVAVCEGGGGRFRLRALHAQPLAPGQDLIQTLRAVLASAGAVHAEAVGVIPREQVLTRVVRFPTTRLDELGPMVALYAKGQLPYPPDQVVTDFYVLVQEEGFSTVVIVACQREVADRFVTVLRDAGLAPVALTMSSSGVLGWYRQALVLEASREPVIVLNVDDARTDLVVIKGGRLLASRGIGQGVQDWSAATEAMEILLLETERTLAAVLKDLPGTEVHSIILTGLGDSGRWSELLRERLGLPVDIIEPPLLPEHSSSPSISAVVAGGSAGTEPSELLNLSPPELRAHVQHRRQVRELVAVSLLVVGVLAFGAGLIAMQEVREQRQAAQVDSVLVDVEPKARRVREKLRMTQVTEAVLSHRRQVATVFSGLLRATPSSVALEGLSFERGRGEVELRGSADSTQAILDYAKELERLDGISAVELKRSARRTGPSGDRADFELLIRVRAAPSGREAQG